jgi:hypothetical protein
MSDRIETYIYESPDGGGTIYRRTMGSLDRELIREGPLRKLQQRSQLWRDIFQSAESDPVLKEMLDQIEVYHLLKDSP